VERLIKVGWIIHPAMRARDACITTLMVAACLATNYTLVGIPNVKLMDFLVFASGLLFGLKVGVAVAVLTWAIYGTLNPYGFCLPILLATTASETIYGLAGGLLGRHGLLDRLDEDGLAWTAYKLGVLGFSLTALYDLLTNLAFAYAFHMPLLPTLALGTYFALVHETSNALIFAFCTPALARLKSLGIPGLQEPSARGEQDRVG